MSETIKCQKCGSNISTSEPSWKRIEELERQLAEANNRARHLNEEADKQLKRAKQAESERDQLRQSLEQAEQRILESQRQESVCKITELRRKGRGGESIQETAVIWSTLDAGVHELYSSPIIPPTVDEAVKAEREAFDELVEKINSWRRAYPLSVFPEPDFEKAHAVLQEHGMTLDAISASNMRHVLKGVGEIIDAAIRERGEK